jgi:hypothetical protein
VAIVAGNNGFAITSVTFRLALGFVIQATPQSFCFLGAGGPATALTVRVHAVTSGTSPYVVTTPALCEFTATFTAASALTSSGFTNITFTRATPCTLAAGTTYLVTGAIPAVPVFFISVGRFAPCAVAHALTTGSTPTAAQLPQPTALNWLGGVSGMSANAAATGGTRFLTNNYAVRINGYPIF